MIVESQGKRYASLADHERGAAMSPRELVEDVIRRKTDGPLTFRLEEDQYTVAALVTIDGRRYTQLWSKALLGDDCTAAEQGLIDMIRKMNAPLSSTIPS